MKLHITGNLRSIANSAWVSTLDESRAESKSDEEVRRVVNFLIDNYHTTPFECVTLTYTIEESENEEETRINDCDASDLSPFYHSKWARVFIGEKQISITCDLFNFIKILKTQYPKDMYRNSNFWLLLESQNNEIANLIDRFKIEEPQSDIGEDLLSSLGENNISVELVNIHNPGIRDHIRATWRIKCPLSISVQMLRHRTGSFNMVSGRYRTLNTSFVDFYDDVKNIFEKFSTHSNNEICNEFENLLSSESKVFKVYSDIMQVAKNAKSNSLISNDEYKRFREFARYILPEGRNTELYVTFYLNDFIHFLNLRNSSHAQKEHAYIAQQMKNEFNKNCIEKI